jgi:hypothetical protein
MRRGRGAYCLIRSAVLSNPQRDVVDHGVQVSVVICGAENILRKLPFPA